MLCGRDRKKMYIFGYKKLGDKDTVFFSLLGKLCEESSVSINDIIRINECTEQCREKNIQFFMAILEVYSYKYNNSHFIDSYACVC